MKLLLLLAAAAATAFAQHPVDAYNVVWTSPSKDSSGSMPLGNGDTGINVWTEETGDVVFYISKSDAWAETTRLVKVGRVRLRMNPNPFASGAPFKQTSNLKAGEIVIEGGHPGSQAKIVLWVDAFSQMIRIDAETQKATEIQAQVERWRDQPRILEGEEVQSAYGLDGGREPIRSFGDTIHQEGDDNVTWFHRNTKSPWVAAMTHQGLADLIPTVIDPLLDRTFGASIRGEGFTRSNATTLRSKAPAQKHALSVYLHTAATSSPEEWLQQLQNTIARLSTVKIEDRRLTHDRYWTDFWDRSYVRITGGPDAEAVTRGYVLQRFLNACAGRGATPIKSNGSLFTVDSKVNDFAFDADFRRQGGPYQFQNTRLIYWPMLASGDYELMQPFFRMYADSLLLAQRRTKLYFNHDGAYFPEIMHHWGTYANSNYGWNRQGKPPSFVENPSIRNYFTGNLELVAMALDYAAYFPQDKQFVRSTLVPVTEQVLTFFDQHYERDADGRLRMNPSQVLGTWHEATNPLPDLAGLRYILNRVVTEKPPVNKQTQTLAKKLLLQLPEFPTKDVAGKKILAPAERVFGEAKNTENPELYAVFPFRIYGVEKADVEMGRETFENRKHKKSGGWQQDAIQAAHLGLANVARQYVLENFTAKSDQRFPAFWGPNFDWTPDQTHGNVASMALQSMLLQADGNKILVAPAWPKDWEVDFKLWAPNNTVVEGSIRGGKLERVKTTPDKRSSDLVRLEPQ
jgi:alpha-L-fucosidase 2